MSAPGRPKRESSLGEEGAQRLVGGPLSAPGRPKRESSLGEEGAQRLEGGPVSSTKPSHEQRFMAEADGVDIQARDLEREVSRLDDWQARLRHGLLASPWHYDGLRVDGSLAQQVRGFQQELHKVLLDWPRQRAELAPVQRLAADFQGKVLWLVFGKFNAGKSSLCNFCAERFAAQGRTVRHFHVEDGRLVDASERFKEGATETTARLQGVQLGQRLVLLDTPGLHSMTPENAALTRRFTDSADGVLWLTSSSSPGQVQELDDLARELRRGKPLLPILTRSDCYEEDEVEGEIVKQLRNKTADNRALQEADVAQRARQKLTALGVDPGLLNAPVSLSVHAARAVGLEPAGLQEAGFERLYASLLAMMAPALLHKQSQPAAILLHHLEEQVVGDWHQCLLPRLAELRRAVEQEVLDLNLQGEAFAARVWRSVIPELPAVLDAHLPEQDVTAVCQEVSRLLEDAVARLSGEVFTALEAVIEPPATPLSLEEGVGYELVAGMVDATRLRHALEQALRQRLLDAAEATTARGRAVLGRLEQQVAGVTALLVGSERELQQIAHHDPLFQTPVA